MLLMKGSLKGDTPSSPIIHIVCADLAITTTLYE